MGKKTIAVIFGGVSSEHDVSLMSARSVLENIPRDEYNVVMLGITKEGRWLLYGGELSRLTEGDWFEDDSCLSAVVSPDRSVHGISVTQKGTEKNIYIDAAFPVLHGKNGEDGTIQGLFELAGIPYVGCGVLSSALCMDKAYTNSVLDHCGIPRCRWDVALIGDDRDEAADRFEKRLKYPIFIKPANAGSSVGISKASDRAALMDAMELAFEHDCKIVAEEFVDALEIECAVLGNDEPVASVPGEIAPCNEFYDYNAKYLDGKSQTYIPARITTTVAKKIQKLAVAAYTALGCSGLARVDFFVTRASGRVMLNEINTIPGFTSISMYPKMMDASGVNYSKLISSLIILALERAGVKDV